MFYLYYNWRKDSFSDLQLFLGINLGLLLLGGFLRRMLNNSSMDSPWLDLYQVMVLTFGQQFPEGDVSFQDQVFSVVVVTIGLAAFALVLALVEQVFMEMLERNVRQGSLVYEQDHIVVLCWCNSPRDVEVVWKILRQICDAYQNEGGKAVVVLSQREKTWMEQMFARAIPEHKRKGTRFVFREGNPLIPNDLKMVSAVNAKSIVIVSDNSRSHEEADAQCIRTAVLLDELEIFGEQSSALNGNVSPIITEMKTRNAVPLLQYACSPRVVALPSNQLNALRLTRMIKQPVIAAVSQSIWSFQSQSQMYLHSFPELTGEKFGDLAFRFNDAVVIGVVDNSNGSTVLCPPLDYEIPEKAEIVLIRPVKLEESVYQGGKYRPNRKGEVSNDWNDWSPQDVTISENNEVAFVYMETQQEFEEFEVEDCVFDSSEFESEDMFSAEKMQNEKVLQQSSFYVLPPEFTQTMDLFEPNQVIIFGWSSMAFMTDLLRELDRGGAHLPLKSRVTFFNNRDPQTTLDVVASYVHPTNIIVDHMYGDPLEITDVRKVSFEVINRAMVLCDEQWLDPDLDTSNGISLTDESDMLRLDSMVMMVQLNVRQILEEKQLPEMNIICEKLSFEGQTRFEDRYRLPLGTSVNLTAFAAKMLTEAIYNPKILLIFTQLGNKVDFHVIDSCFLAEEREEVTWWELVARAQKLDSVLVGYYEIPRTIKKPLEMKVNVDENERFERRVWNFGDQRVKLLTLQRKKQSLQVQDFHQERLDQFLIDYTSTSVCDEPNNLQLAQNDG